MPFHKSPTPPGEDHDQVARDAAAAAQSDATAAQSTADTAVTDAATAQGTADTAAADLAAHGHALADLSDVDDTGAAEGDVLTRKADGSYELAAAAGGGGGLLPILSHVVLSDGGSVAAATGTTAVAISAELQLPVTVPASGSILVELAGTAYTSNTSVNSYWRLYDLTSATTIWTGVTGAGGSDTNVTTRAYVDGLTPGQELNLEWRHYHANSTGTIYIRNGWPGMRPSMTAHAV